MVGSVSFGAIAVYYIVLSTARSLLIRGRPLTVLTVDSGVLLRTAKDPDTV